VAGASSGIGEATARALAASGYRLALIARRADRIEALADELGNGSIAIQADVTDRESIIKAAGRVKAEPGGTDVLVNNAGIMLLAPFNGEGHDDHRRMIEANLLGAITVTEVFLDQLVDGGGDLVNLSSVAGRTARGQAKCREDVPAARRHRRRHRRSHRLRRHPPPPHDPQRNPGAPDSTALTG
jgi:NADP-dependent 3-hydroxy acid dehydrogenase YdfG